MPGEDKGAAGGDVQQQLADVQARLGTLETENKGLKDAKVDLERKLDDADKELLSEDYLNFKDGKAKGGNGGGGAGAGGGGGGKGAAGGGDDIDLDRASNREIVEYIGKKYSGDLAGMVKDLTGRIDKTDKSVGLALAQIDISLTSMRHNGNDGKPGFNDNFDAIKEVAKANPSWNAEKCYQQFILEKDKGDKDAAAAAKKKVEEDEKALTEKGGGVPSAATQDVDISKEKAAELGYKQAFGNTEK